MKNNKILKIMILMLIFVVFNASSVNVNAKTVKTKFQRVGPKKITLKVGNSKKLKIRKKNVKNVKWVSKNKKVATVTNKGLVTAKNKGKAKIVVKSKIKKGAKKNKNKKLYFKVIVKAVSGSSITTNNGNFNKKTEKGIEKWMSSYDNPKYANFADYPYLDKQYKKICEFNKMILQKNWELVPSYIRGACLYNKIKIKFDNNDKDVPYTGNGLADYGKKYISVGLTFNYKYFGSTLSHEMAHIYHFQLKEYIKNITFEKEYKANKNKYGKYGSTSKYEFFSEKIAMSVIQNQDFIDINYIDKDIMNNASLIQYGKKYYIMINGDKYILNADEAFNEKFGILKMSNRDFLNYLYSHTIEYVKNKGYDVSKVIWERDYIPETMVNLGKITDL